MSVRVNLEIGHEASLRTKKTPEGFTHDWEVFVRGCDSAAIQYYVEKVVFHLHETFPKPKRVVKEPPYTVKESGYAGFNLPIDIYLRNREEPKKIRFNYDLHLQNTGPPVLKIQKEKYVFNSPTDDFKHKLLKGGGVIVNVPTSFQDISENHTIQEDKMQMTSKPKLSGTEVSKKYKMKIEDMRMSDSFQDLFGTPIKKPPEPKLPPKDLKNSTIKSEKGSEKEKSKSKHSPHKDKDRDKLKEKGDSERKNRDEKKKEKERSKDRERSKEKSSKREKSPRPRSVSPKRPSSPKRPTSPTSKLKERDEKRVDSINKEKDKKVSEEKSEKKSKKEKRDKDKEHKDKHKDRDSQKISEHKMKELKPNRDIIKDSSPHPPKIEKKDKPKDGSKDSEKERKDAEVKTEEKPKHKHKKKDKEKREKKDDKEKSHKSEKKLDKIPTSVKYHESIKETPKESDKNQFSPKNEPQPTAIENKPKDKPQKPLNALFSEFVDNDSSNSSLSSHEPSPSVEIQSEKNESLKKEPVFEQKKNKSDLGEKVKIKKEKIKKNKEKKSEKDGDKKRKRKSDVIVEDEAPADKVPKEEPNTGQMTSDQEQATSASPIREINKENQENPEDYMQILKDLQQKIMTLQDNTELQKVVQLIAETGRFEVSARTFDFDLCLLERSTVKQLQEFFSNTS